MKVKNKGLNTMSILLLIFSFFLMFFNEGWSVSPVMGIVGIIGLFISIDFQNCGDN